MASSIEVVAVDDEAAILLDPEQQIIVEEPFHDREALNTASNPDGSTNFSGLVPYTDDPDGQQRPLVDSKATLNPPGIYKLLIYWFLFTIAFGGNVTPKINIVLSLVCREFYSQNPETDSFLVSAIGKVVKALTGDIDDSCQIAPIHAKASTVNLWVSLTVGAFGTLSSPYIGSFSDRFGRKPLLIVATLGPLFSDIVVIFATKSLYLKSYYLFIVAAAVEGSTGAYVAVSAICHSYVTDCTPPEKRAAAFGLLHGVLYGGMAIGPTIASLMVNKTGSVITFFYFGVFLQLLFIFSVIFIIPESLPKEMKHNAQEVHRQKILAKRDNNNSSQNSWTFNLKRFNFLKPLSAFYPNDGTRPIIKRNLVLLAVLDCMAVGNSYSELTAVLMYSEYAFKWSTVETGYYLTTIGICRVILLFLVLPNVVLFLRKIVGSYHRRHRPELSNTKLFGASDVDLLILRGSALIGMTAHLGFLLTSSPIYFRICGAFGAFSGSLAPGFESVISKHVRQRNIGKVLGAVGLMHSISRAIAPTFFLSVYSLTVGWFSKALFLCFFANFFNIFIGTFFIAKNVPGGLMENPSDEDDEGNTEDEVAHPERI
ncbi:major facilitator superfamily domain-containing protein [Lipomyces japonicus]|uniref:major facilitator superfamily domain-containing protein n=1 Tax=Lipomyces japonicus TaxID=56871 RepID=UPI0034CE2E41